MGVKKLSNGNWQADYRDVANIRRRPQFKTKREALAEEELNRRKKQAYSEELNYSHAVEMTVGDLKELWWDRATTMGQSKRGPLGLAAQGTRQSIWDARIKPTWEHVRLDTISHDKAATWLLSEQEKPNSSQSHIHMVGTMLVQILDEGVRLGILESNPAKDRLGNALYIPPNNTEKDHIYLTPQQLWLLASTMRTARDRAMVLVGGLSGLRYGEAIALLWGDIDFDGNEINITKAYSRLKLKTPKSGKSRSTILNLPTRNALLEMGPGKPDEHVFRTRFNKPMTGGSWRYRLKAAVDHLHLEAGLPILTYHDLRHTAVSIAISAGLNIKVVQNIAGHAKPSTTLDVYAGLFQDDLSEATKKVDSVIGGHFLDTSVQS